MRNVRGMFDNNDNLVLRFDGPLWGGGRGVSDDRDSGGWNEDFRMDIVWVELFEKFYGEI